MENSRRKFIRQTSLIALSGLAFPTFAQSVLKRNAKESTTAADVDAVLLVDPPFSLPQLPYGYDALEPNIDKMTMEIHHTKHHKAYVDNLNKALKDLGKENLSLDDIIKNASTFPITIRNNGGGHWNHSFFWKLMKPGGGGDPSGKIAAAIQNAFGSFGDFKTKLEDAALKRFGSGWAWLVVDANKKLAIGSTPNQDNPLMDLSEFKGIPILGIDVWEHAYYLKYQNKRADYVKSWWNVLNWEEINKNLEHAG